MGCIHGHYRSPIDCQTHKPLLIPATPGIEVRGIGEMFPLNDPSWSLFFEYIGNILLPYSSVSSLLQFLRR